MEEGQEGRGPRILGEINVYRIEGEGLSVRWKVSPSGVASLPTFAIENSAEGIKAFAGCSGRDGGHVRGSVSTIFEGV